MKERDYAFGLDSLMAITAGLDGELVDGDQVVRDVVQEGFRAQRLGTGSFHHREHCRDDMMDSPAHVVLALIAARPDRIRLATAVSVLSMKSFHGWDSGSRRIRASTTVARQRPYPDISRARCVVGTPASRAL